MCYIYIGDHELEDESEELKEEEEGVLREKVCRDSFGGG